jgi:hypothetical protein
MFTAYHRYNRLPLVANTLLSGAMIVIYFNYQLSQELSEARKLSSLLEDKVQTLQQEASRYVPATKVAEVHSKLTMLCC